MPSTARNQKAFLQLVPPPPSAIKKIGLSSILSPPSPRSSFFPLRIPPSTDAKGNCVTAPRRPWQCQNDQLRTFENRHRQWQLNHFRLSGVVIGSARTNGPKRPGVVIGSVRTKGRYVQGSSSAVPGRKAETPRSRHRHGKG